jgi:hypothetical protein
VSVSLAVIEGRISKDKVFLPDIFAGKLVTLRQSDQSMHSRGVASRECDGESENKD